jgi:hypothetical protein
MTINAETAELAEKRDRSLVAPPFQGRDPLG